jgi:hypothetical protein
MLDHSEAKKKIRKVRTPPLHCALENNETFKNSCNNEATNDEPKGYALGDPCVSRSSQNQVETPTMEARQGQPVAAEIRKTYYPINTRLCCHAVRRRLEGGKRGLLGVVVAGRRCSRPELRWSNLPKCDVVWFHIYRRGSGEENYNELHLASWVRAFN